MTKKSLILTGSIKVNCIYYIIKYGFALSFVYVRYRNDLVSGLVFGRMSSCIQISRVLYIKKKKEPNEIRCMKSWLPVHSGELQRDINMNFSIYVMEEMTLTLSHMQFVFSTVWWPSSSRDLTKTKKRKDKALGSLTKHPLPLSYNLTNSVTQITVWALCHYRSISLDKSSQKEEALDQLFLVQ